MRERERERERGGERERERGGGMLYRLSQNSRINVFP